MPSHGNGAHVGTADPSREERQRRRRCINRHSILAWIDVGSPASERIHKAAKAARAVAIWTTEPLTALREAAPKIHRASEIDVVTLPASLVSAIEAKLERTLELELVRSDGHLYVTFGSGGAVDAPLAIAPLLPQIR